LFGETLVPAQLAGGALVLVAVLVIRVPARAAVTPTRAAAPATAHTSAPAVIRARA
jgi:hypothetical protein